MTGIRGALAALVLLASSGAGLVDGAPDAFFAPPPDPPPPAGFDARLYTDSRGCAFARAEHGGQAIWAPLFEGGVQSCAAAVPPPSSSAPRACGLPREAGRYAQAGIFAQTDNALRAEARIRALGLPALRVAGRDGHEIVVAGPFDTWRAAREGLGRLRCHGFPDAFGLNTPPGSGP